MYSSIKRKHTSLDIIRIGTSGALQNENKSKKRSFPHSFANEIVFGLALSKFSTKGEDAGKKARWRTTIFH
ncbi:hypothetical protein N9K77_00920 [bacterium]|nr:hypothetical protein [bacterium]